jgi:hypothetical protein
VSKVSSACKTEIKYSLFQSLRCLSCFKEDGAPSNIKLSCYCYHTRLYPTQARPCCPTPLILSLLGLNPLSSLFRSHVLLTSSKFQYLLLGSFGCSMPRTMSFRAASLVACASNIPIPSDPPTLDDMLTFTPIVLHAYNKPYRCALCRNGA